MSEEKRANGFSDDNIRVETASEKCDCCGANMAFDPEKNQLLCSHCGNTRAIKDLGDAEELALSDAFSRDEKWSESETVVFKCDNCGAKVVLKNGESAKSCPFCATAHVQKSSELAGLKPNAVIPFAFNKEKAVEFSKAWAKKGLFTCGKFKKNLNAENIQGVYAPCFTFDSYTTSHYSGKIGKIYTRVVGSGKNRRTETYVVWKHISGTYYSNFDDILITAGSKFDQDKLNKLAPYHTNGSEKYAEEYLLGYMAYHYDQEITDCWGQAKSIIDSSVKSQILGQYSYDKLAYLDVSTTHEHVTYKYVMLPVYMGNFRFNKKNYNFSVNGASGRVTGKRPKSPLKIAVAVSIGLAVLGTIGYLIYKYLVG